MSRDLVALEEAHLAAREALRVGEEALILAQKEVEALLHFQVAGARDAAQKLLLVIEKHLPDSPVPAKCRAKWGWINGEEGER